MMKNNQYAIFLYPVCSVMIGTEKDASPSCFACYGITLLAGLVMRVLMVVMHLLFQKLLSGSSRSWLYQGQLLTFAVIVLPQPSW